MTRRTFHQAALLVVSAVLVACTLVALLALSERKAEAAFPGQNGRIAYFDDRPENEDWEIYSMNPDGTERERLTDNSAEDYAPTVSPDGTEIAFVSHRSGSPKIYVMDADGTGERNISGPEGGDFDPAWSPDGTEIAFVRGKNVWVMDADGTDRRNLTDTGPVGGYDVSESMPAWSPDGTRLAFSKRIGRPSDADLYTISPDGTGLRRVADLPGQEYSPDWSPSGHRLAYYRSTRLSEARVYTIRPDGTGKKLIVQGGESPVFSPDGNRIAFTRERDLHKIKSDGSGEPVSVRGPAGAAELVPDWGPAPTAAR